MSKINIIYFAKNLIKTTITYTIWLSTGLTLLPIIMLVTFIPRKDRYNNRLYFWLTDLCAKTYIYSSFFKFTVTGQENLPNHPDNPAIILINHASSLDIPITMLLLKKYPHVWLSNDYSKIPFLGCILKRMHIIVNRSKRVQVLHSACNLAKNRSLHLLIFPEGTRYDDGKIHDFFGGFVVLASQLKRPIIPIIISGIHKIYSKKSYLIDSSACTVKISIGKPIYYDTTMSRQEFADNVHKWFEIERETLRQTPRLRVKLRRARQGERSY
ncbi:MAG: lysophospholipid acyltransferase family protein [bacterium]